MQLHDNSLLKTQAHIDGQWVDADSGETLAVVNPANGETIAEVVKCGTAETRRMIEAAAVAKNSGLNPLLKSAPRYCVAGLIW